MTTFQSTEKAISDQLCTIVKNSVVSVFNTIFGSEPSCMEDSEDSKKYGEGVVGIISYMGDINWMMMLTMPRKSAEALTLKFTGFEVPYESNDMGDVVGELANVLAGDLVARLGNEGIKVAMSLPTIMRGHDVEPLLPQDMPTRQMIFELPEGAIHLKIAGSKSGDHGRKPGA